MAQVIGHPSPRHGQLCHRVPDLRNILGIKIIFETKYNHNLKEHLPQEHMTDLVHRSLNLSVCGVCARVWRRGERTTVL